MDREEVQTRLVSSQPHADPSLGPACCDGLSHALVVTGFVPVATWSWLAGKDAIEAVPSTRIGLPTNPAQVGGDGGLDRIESESPRHAQALIPAGQVQQAVAVAQLLDHRLAIVLQVDTSGMHAALAE